MRLFADDQGEASLLLLPVDGDWFAAYSAVASDVEGFAPMRQYRPVTRAAMFADQAMWRPYTTIAKAVAWWVDEESGAGFFPGEASAHVPIHAIPLRKSYWVDGCGAQEGSRVIWWTLEAVNQRSAGLVVIDPMTLKGTLDGKPGRPYLPDGAVQVTVEGEGRAPRATQVNWMGYRTDDGFYLAIVNDVELAAKGVRIQTSDALSLPGKPTVRNVQLEGPASAAGSDVRRPLGGSRSISQQEPAETYTVEANSLKLLFWRRAGGDER